MEKLLVWKKIKNVIKKSYSSEQQEQQLDSLESHWQCKEQQEQQWWRWWQQQQEQQDIFFIFIYILFYNNIINYNTIEKKILYFIFIKLEIWINTNF